MGSGPSTDAPSPNVEAAPAAAPAQNSPGIEIAAAVPDEPARPRAPTGPLKKGGKSPLDFFPSLMRTPGASRSGSPSPDEPLCEASASSQEPPPSDGNSSSSSSSSSSGSGIGHWASSVWSGFKGVFVSPETEAALKSIHQLLDMYYKDMPHVEMAAGLMLLAKQSEQLQKEHVPALAGALRQLCPGDDAAHIREATIAMHHASAAYGWKVCCGFMHHVCEEEGPPPASTLAPILHDSNEGNLASLLKHTGVSPSDIVETRWHSKPFSPGHYVLVDRKLDAAVVAFRGTWGLKDSVADLVACPEPFTFHGITGFAHKGVYSCAIRKAEELLGPRGPVECAVESLVAMKRVLLVTGHSLGGGVATIFALIAAERHPEWDVRCYAFAPAPSLTLDLAKSHDVRKMVRSYLFRDDLVPRLSLGSLGVLKRTVQKLQLQSDSAAEKPSRLKSARHVTHFVAASKIMGNKLSNFLSKSAGGISVAQAVADARADSLHGLLVGNDPTFMFPCGHIYIARPVYEENSAPQAPGDPSECKPPGKDKKAQREKEKFILEEFDQLSFMNIVISSDMFIDHLPHKTEMSLDTLSKEWDTAASKPEDLSAPAQKEDCVVVVREQELAPTTANAI